MYDIAFAESNPVVQTTDMNEALLKAEQLHVTTSPFYLRDLKVKDDGMITYGNNDCKITKYGFERFYSRVLGIPMSYGRKIPRDLLFHTINRLQKDKGGTEVVVCSRENGEVAAIVKAPYDECFYEDVLGSISERQDIKYITISEERMIVCLMFEELTIAGVGDTDHLNVGTFLFNSIVKDTSLSMFSGLYRTSCTNSFIMPYLGRIRASYMVKDHSLRLLRFVENMRCYDASILALLGQNFGSTFTIRKFFDNDIKKYWQSLNKTVGSADADRLMKLDEESRKNLIQTVQLREHKNKRAKLLGEAVDENIPTDLLAYDVLNDITTYAQTIGHIERIALEKLGGEIIKSLVLN